MLGGEPKGNPGGIFDLWETGMKEPNVRGLTVGRNLLYPSDGDSLQAATRASALVHGPHTTS